MTFGDYIRSKDDKELAKMLINTITENSDYTDMRGFNYIYLDDFILSAFDEDELAEILSREIEEREVKP